MPRNIVCRRFWSAVRITLQVISTWTYLISQKNGRPTWRPSRLFFDATRVTRRGRTRLSRAHYFFASRSRICSSNATSAGGAGGAAGGSARFIRFIALTTRNSTQATIKKLISSVMKLP